jgi:DNA polymerase I-like protein with 3'-5' exonuclease and polymerase domains
MIVTFDVESTTYNKGNPFTASNKMVCYSVKVDGGPIDCAYYDDLEFLRPLRYTLEAATLLVGFNIKYDLHWARRYGVLPNSRSRVWDCQIAEFILRGQRGSYPSLDESLTRFNLGQKDDKIAEYWAIGVQTTDIPPDELRRYNMRDVELTYNLYLAQQKVMTEKQIRLCMVMGLDLLVLEEMEWNGIKFDIEKCKQKADETAKDLTTITAELRKLLNASDDVNLDSGHQLSCLLYGGAFELTRVSHVDRLIYKSGPRKGEEYDRNRYETKEISCPPLFTPLKGSETKLKSKVGEKEYPIYATGEDVLKQLKRPSQTLRRIVDLLLERAEKAKLLDTYYGKLPATLEQMEWGEYLHGQFNQVVAATGRLSSSNPNMQNFSDAVDELLVSRYVS